MAVALALAGHAAAASAYDGLTLKKWAEDYANNAGFNAGLYAGYVIAVKDVFDGILFCIPGGSSNAQIVGATSTYLQQHPDRMNDRAHAIVTSALIAAFPCKK
ncbi:MAG: Rap1a/Tai family immunity protein [Pseudomonadota bacterium]